MPALLNMDENLELPEDAHYKAMELLRSPPENAVAVLAHRGYHDTATEDARGDVPEHSRASLMQAAKMKLPLVEMDLKYGFCVHEDRVGRVVDFGRLQGLSPFNVSDTVSDQSRVNPLVKDLRHEDIDQFMLRTPKGELTNETLLNGSIALKFVADQKLPINFVFDPKTRDDIPLAARLLAETNHFNGRPFIETGMVKVMLKDVPTPQAYDEMFGFKGPNGKPVGDELKLILMVVPNHLEELGGEQGVIDKLAAHRDTGRFFMPEINIKDDKGLSQVKEWLRETGSPWMGTYQTTVENDSLLDKNLAKDDWNQLLSQDSLFKHGEEKILYLPDGTCCHSPNSDLFGSEYDKRISAAAMHAQGVNFFTTDRPAAVIKYLEGQGKVDISTLVMQDASGHRKAPGLSSPAAGGSSSGVHLVGALLTIGGIVGLSYLAYARSNKRDTAHPSVGLPQKRPATVVDSLKYLFDCVRGGRKPPDDLELQAMAKKQDPESHQPLLPGESSSGESSSRPGESSSRAQIADSQARARALLAQNAARRREDSPPRPEPPAMTAAQASRARAQALAQEQKGVKENLKKGRGL